MTRNAKFLLGLTVMNQLVWAALVRNMAEINRKKEMEFQIQRNVCQILLKHVDVTDPELHEELAIYEEFLNIFSEL